MKTRDYFWGLWGLGLALIGVSCKPEAMSPEERFETYLCQEYDRNGDGELDRDECLAVDTIIWQGEDLVSVEGLQRFENLVYLDCSNNHISGLDFSKNLKIRHVDVVGNPLSMLDVSKNEFLETLDISGTNIQSLNLHPDVKLERLVCVGNDLRDMSGMSLEHCARLRVLDFSYNDLISLELAFPSLDTLRCCYNEGLACLDLDSCPNLVYLDCGDCQIGDLDISSCGKLAWLYCSDNQIDTLDLTSFPRLSMLGCSANRISFLDFSGNPELRYVSADLNHLVAVDLSACPKLENAFFGSNERVVRVEGNRLDLRELGGGFDWKKVTRCHGGYIENGVLYWDEDGSSVMYHYATGSVINDLQTVSFTLQRE